MFLYNSYCYQTIQDISDQFVSHHFIGDGKFLVSSVVRPDLVSLTLTVDDSGIQTSSVYVPASCTKLGFSSSYTGLTTADSVELGGLISMSLIIVWGIKYLRRAT